jgi:hypothetical protein
MSYSSEELIPTRGRVALYALSALLWPSVLVYAHAGITKIGQTLSDNCGPDMDLTGIGVYQLVVSIVTALVAAAITWRWRRTRSLGSAWLLAPVLVISWIAFLAGELNTVRFC